MSLLDRPGAGALPSPGVQILVRRRGRAGQATVEYALVVSLIGVAAVALLLLFRDPVRVLYEQALSAFGPLRVALMFL